MITLSKLLVLVFLQPLFQTTFFILVGKGKGLAAPSVTTSESGLEHFTKALDKQQELFYHIFITTFDQNECVTLTIEGWHLLQRVGTPGEKIEF